MCYNCTFKDYNPYRTTTLTQSDDDNYIWEMQHKQDVNGPMPYLIIHHNLGNMWHTYADFSTEGSQGIPWHLGADKMNQTPDLHINAKYYPTLGVHRYSAAIEIKEDEVSNLKDWVVNSAYFEPWYKEFKAIQVPAISLSICLFWNWLTKKPCDGDMPYRNTAHIIFPNIWKFDGTHDRDDNFFGESYIEWDNEKYILGDLTELELAYDALKREFNLLRSTYG